jgi:hypothetical protein
VGAIFYTRDPTLVSSGLNVKRFKSAKVHATFFFFFKPQSSINLSKRILGMHSRTKAIWKELKDNTFQYCTICNRWFFPQFSEVGVGHKHPKVDLIFIDDPF